jgi:hypothetical protein
MNSAAFDIKAQLVLLGVIASGFVGEEPATPNDVVTVYDTGGGEPFAGIELYEPSIQVRVRNTSYAAAYALQQEIRKALIVPTDFEINNTHYIGVWNMGDIISLGKDQNNRAVFTANYRIERQPL